MAVSIEAAFVMLDRASGPLREIARNAALADKALSGMGGSLGMGGAQRDIAKTTQLLDAQGNVLKTIEVKTKDATAATDKHTRSLTPLGAAFRNVGVHAGNFWKSIENSTRSLLKQHPAIISTTKGLAGLGGAAAGAWKAFGVLPGLVASFLPQIVALAGAIGGLATSLIGAVGGGVAIGGGLLGSFAAGLGTIAGVAKPAITSLTEYRTAVTNLNKAMASGDAKQIAAAQQQVNKLAKETPGVAGLNRELTGFTSEWKKATAPGREDFFKLATSSIAETRKQLGWLSKDANANMGATRNAVEKNLKPILDALRSLETGLSRVFRANIGGFAGGFTNILRGLSNILKVIEPQLTGVGNGFERLTDRFAKWTASARGASVIKDTTDAFREWMRLLGQIVILIGHVTGAGMKAGTSEISMWADKLTKLNQQLGTGEGQKRLENWFAKTMDNTNKLWGPLKNVADSVLLLAKAWEPIGTVVKDILGKFPAPVLTGMLALYAGAKGLGTARGVAGAVGGPLSKFAGKGETPLNPLYVADVSGGLGGGGLGGGKAAEGGRLARWAEKGGVRGRIAGGLAKVGVGTEAGVLATAAERGGVVGRAAGALSGAGGRLTQALEAMVKSPSALGKGAEEASLFKRLITTGTRGIGGATGGMGHFGLAMAAAPAAAMAARVVPRALRESTLGREAGGAISGFMQGGVMGAGVMAVNRLLPQSLRRARGTQRVTSAAMGATTGATVGGILGAGIGTLVGGPAGTAAGAAIGQWGGGAIGAAMTQWNPFSEKGRRQIATDAKNTWNTLKSGAEATGKWVAKTASYYNPFTAAGQRHIAQSAVKTWDTVKSGAVAAAKWVAGTAVRFNPFSASGRRNILNGAKAAWDGIKAGARGAWNGVKAAFSAAGKWFAGVGKAIAKPFTDAFNWVKNAARNVFNWILGAAKSAWKGLETFFTKTPLGRWMIWPFQQAWNFIRGVPGKIVGAFKGLGSSISKEFSKVKNAVTKPFSDAWDWVTKHVPKIEIKTKHVPILGNVPSGIAIHMQQGGTVPRSAPVLVGEAGPEIVHLPAGTRVTPTHQIPRYAAQAGRPAPIGGIPGQVVGGAMHAGAAAAGGGLDPTLKATQAAFAGLLKQAQQIQNVFKGLTGSLNRVEDELTNGRSGLVGALTRAENEFTDFGKQAQSSIGGTATTVFRNFDRNVQDRFTSIDRNMKWLLDQFNKVMVTNTKTYTDQVTNYFRNLDKNLQTAWKNMVVNTRWGIDQIFKATANAFKQMGVPAPKGIAPSKKETGGRLAKAERGYRLPGEPKGDHIPLVAKGGTVLAMADGGELVVNRHTERRVNAMLAEKGTTLGREVAGETVPHARGIGSVGAPGESQKTNLLNTMRYRDPRFSYAALGLRVPGLQGGGVVPFNQLKTLWTQAGGPAPMAQTMAAIAEAESSANPRARNPSGASGLWQILGQIVPGNIFDPLVNARNAVAKYKSQGLGAWVVYTTGAYKKFMGGAATPAGMGGGGAPVIAAPTLAAPNVRGAGAIGDLGQGAINKIVAAANQKLQDAAGAYGGGGAGAPGVLTPGGPRGTSVWKGITMATWVAEALKYAQSKGVSPQPTSGYRPGRDPHTATGTSEHQGLQYPHGAVDFGGYDTGLAQKMAVVNATRDFKYPLLAPIGFHDDGHCSGTGHALGGRIPWFREGADFIARRPQLVGVGDAAQGERVTITPQGIQRPAGNAGGIGGNVHIEIHNIQVHRKGDVQKIVDEEMQALAHTIQGRL